MEFLTNYNALVVLDIDKITPEKLTESKEILKENPFVFAFFTSPSGNGLKIFIKVDSGKDEHKETFLKLQRYFEDILSLEIDKSGKDITRLCFFSYDPELFVNEACTIFSTHSNQSQEQTTKTNKTSSSQIPNTINYDVLYTHCVQFTEKKESFIDGNRNNFVYQLANNLNRKGVPESVALGYILADYDYNSQEVMAAVRSAYSNTADFNTDAFQSKQKNTKKNIHKEADQSLAEIESEEELPPLIDRLENFLNNRYHFRHNEVLGKLEYKPIRKKESSSPSGRSGGAWKPMTDFKENSILREIQKAKVKCSINSLRNLLHSDFCEMYDPFKDYFENLPEYNDSRDYIEELALTITTTKPELWKTCFKKWFVAMVACVVNEKQINQTVIVFSGKQGLGKTTWIEKLMPKELKQYIFSGTINPNNKDTLIHLAECMLINLDELENLNRTEIGSLKELITKTHIRMRKAYGHNNENMPRRASFAGSVNTAQFLNDTTGSRRFLCFEVEHIEYQHEIDINLCYAQAYKLFQEGFRHWFNQEEIKEINANNEQYQLRSPEEELLLTWFESATKETAKYFLNTTQILQILTNRASININDASVAKLGKALRKHNYTRVAKNNSYVYAVNLLEFEEVDRKNQDNGEPQKERPKQSEIPFRFQ